MILPGATLGILGGGQLGRMFVLAARTMGYKVIVLDPDQDSPAAQLANRHIRASYTNSLALDSLARDCAAITTEFENVPAESLEYLAGFCPVRPSGAAVAVAQDRIREKRFLQENGFETARFSVVEERGTLPDALKQTGTPALIKLSRTGYDGKGQRLVHNLGEAGLAFDDFGAKPCVLEEWLDIQTEVSVVIARGDASAVAYPPSENWHRDGILDVSVAPARIPPMLATTAIQTALRIAELLGYCGVITVEFFVLKDGRLLVNEIAPRPHNTGHYTVDACLTSQFEQQVRALCGLPLGDTTQFSPSVMVNLLGDLWHEGREPAWEHVLRNPRAKLHLYGKCEARPGRKMGHYTCLASSVEDALSHALEIRTLIGADRLLDPVGFGCAESGDEPHDLRGGIKRVS
jgi:5-(carboxyamino)imidazole ribonucleotide synthase